LLKPLGNKEKLQLCADMNCRHIRVAHCAWIIGRFALVLSQLISRWGSGDNRSLNDINQTQTEADMTRDELNRELRMHSATWQAVALVYGALVGTLVLSAMAVMA
jgi:hypothetical protein